MRFRKALIPVLSLLCVAAVITSLFFSNKLRQATRDVKRIVVDQEVWKKKLEGQPPEWMMRQIQKDLSTYASGITKKMLDEAYKGEKISTFNLIRFQIADGYIAFSHDEKNLYSRHFRELLGFVKTLNHLVKLPNVDFIVSLEDGFSANPNIGPCFVFAAEENVKDLILIPDIKALAGYTKLRKAIPEANERHPWESKIAMGFWRGATTGGYSTQSNWNLLARTKLVLMSLAQPQIVDARFNMVVQCDPEIPKMFKTKGLVSKSVDRPTHLKYKYLVDVDGNSCSFERYFWLLLSNSLVLKQITPNIQWYYGGLEPYKHYLPVKEDLSDLSDKLCWAKEHDVEAKQMAENATRFVEENLTAEDTLLYFYLLIKEYAKLASS